MLADDSLSDSGDRHEAADLADASEAPNGIAPVALREPTLDMVCIPPEHSWLVASLHPLQALSLAAWLLGFAWLFLSTWFFSSHYALGGELCIPLWLICVVAPFLFQVVFQMAYRHYRSFPTNLECNSAGLYLAWKHSRTYYSELIPWQAVFNVAIAEKELPKGKQGKEQYVTFEVDLRQMGMWDRVHIVMHTQSLWRDYRFLSRGILRLQFPLQALTLEADKARFATFLRNELEQTKVDSSISQFCDNKGVPSYTQLWLDDMQSFRRARTGALTPGDALNDGKYQVETALAIGGQARIYRALNNHTGDQVVLKEFVLPTNAGSDVRGESFAHVRKEASFLETLDHPSIVRLLEHFVEDHRAYLVLEYVEGQTLRRLVKDSGAQKERESAATLRAALDICRFFHSQSPPIVHRDLTPDNFIRSQTGQLTLIDFSVAQFMEAARTRTVCGKHNYMAPEQFRGNPCTQSDLYSLGCTAYFLITGEDPLPLSCLSIPESFDASSDFSKVISKLTKLTLEDRYKTADEAIFDLDQLSCLI